HSLSDGFPHVPLMLLSFQHNSKPTYLINNPLQATMPFPGVSLQKSARFLQNSQRFMVALVTKLVTSSH
ncbi:MAG: hypothetical protein MKZ70_11770, partial [Opitutales bacterium]|nr:hypothetical protein [Opitutales bacterium]